MTYKVYLSTKVTIKSLKKGSGIIVIEPEDYKKDEVKAIKDKGYKVLAYLSVGTIEKERSWWKTYSKYKLKQLPDWPKEYYVDVRKTGWRKFLANRAKSLLDAGYDGWWLDNIDVYSEYKSKAMFTALAAVFLKLKAMKGYIMINGGSEWVDDAIDRKETLTSYINGYTQEEVFSRIINYSGKGKFGKQKADDKKFYQSLIKKAIKRKVQCFLLEYTKDEDLKAGIKEWCKTVKANYYISSDVNL